MITPAGADASVQNTAAAAEPPASPTPSAPVATHASLAAVPSEPAPAAAAPAAEPDLLASRMQATLEWLQRAAPDTHCIQLLGAENPQQLKEHLSSIAKSIEITNLYVYRTVARQKPFLTVLYGSFGTREAAQNALDRLPPPLKAFRPLLRTVQGIREEMSRNKTL
jgi:septal ring-binding cell division protein DamX